MKPFTDYAAQTGERLNYRESSARDAEIGED
jgi:hypothetical protein